MNRIITLLCLFFVAGAAGAQHKADIEVCYTALSPSLRNGKVEVKNHYVLLANTKESKFFSPVTQYIDSINSTPEGAARWKEMTRAAVKNGDFENMPKKDGSYYILKSVATNSLRHYDNSGLDKYCYDETPLHPQAWEITDSTKNILGYECVKATTDYHGRRWTAWFTPEIPLQNGPWKLGGLPGLILEAMCDDGKYSFVATGIQNTTKSVGPIYLADSYEKTDRKSYLKAKRAFLDNPLGQINAKYGEKGVIVKSDGPIFASSKVVDLIETDYR